MGGAYDFEVNRLSGDPVKLSEYRGKALLIVNTASRCGFTPQYGGLEKLYGTFKCAVWRYSVFRATNLANRNPVVPKRSRSFAA